MGLVGRESEIALLRRAVDEAVDGRARSVLIAGEPGIGKTALAEEAATAATKAGATTLWGACWEGEGAPAFWPWVQIIRSYASGRPTGDLLDEMGEGAADVARLVPEVGGRFLSLTPEGDVDPEQARFRLFDHVSRFLHAAAAKQPLCLVFDDLHWADRSSLMLLRFFAQAMRDARVLVLGTYRDVELTSDHRHALADLSGERISLSGLAKNEVAALMQITTGSEPPPDLTTAVFGRTTGNPFFVKEVARLLDAQGRLDTGGPGIAIPEGVRDVVRRRLARQSQDTVALLGAASVLGPEFGIDLLGQLTNTNTSQVLAALDEAVTARIVAESADTVGRYAFAHALVREVLYEDLGAARRAALHWETGELLSHRGPSDAHLPEIAHHLVKGAAAGDPTKAADAAVRAARGASRMYAWDQAADMYARALDSMRIGGLDEPLRVRTMLELGDAQIRAGDLAAARVVYEEAAALASSLGLSSELAHAALGLGGGLGGFEVPLFDETQIALLHRALEQLPSEDSAVRAWLLARRSVASSFVIPAEERAELSREAIAMARRLGDRGALSYALSSLCDALAGPDDVAERIAASTEMIDLAAEPAAGAARCGVESCAVCLCDPEFALLGRRLRVVANLEAGDVDAVDKDVEAYARLAEHLRQPLYLWYAPLFRGMRAIMRGDLDEAERHLDLTTGIAGRTSSGNASLLAGVQRLGLALERGDTAAATNTWREIRASSPEQRRFRREATSTPCSPLWAATRRKRSPCCNGGSASVVWSRRPKTPNGWRAPRTSPTPPSAPPTARPPNTSTTQSSLTKISSPSTGSRRASWDRSRITSARSQRSSAVAAPPRRTSQKAIALHAATGAVLWAARSKLGYARLLHDAGDPRAALRGELSRDAAAAFSASGLDADAAEASALAEGAPAAPAAAKGNSFRREGEYWTVTFDGSTAHLKDSKGLGDIAVLVASPGREIAALDLIARDAGPGPRAKESHAGEVLDDQARAAYKARIAELQSEIDDDPAGATRAREELDALTEQLAGAYGLGGRARRAGDPAERARKAVTERIRDALAKLKQEHPALHRHLKASIRTGAFCSYSPERAVTWAL